MSELQEFFSYDDVNNLGRALLAFQSSHEEDQGGSFGSLLRFETKQN